MPIISNINLYENQEQHVLSVRVTIPFSDYPHVARGVRSGTTEKGLMSDGSPRGDFYRKQLLFSFKKKNKQSAYGAAAAGNKVKSNSEHTMVNV